MNAPILYWLQDMQRLLQAPAWLQDRFADGQIHKSRNQPGPVQGRLGMYLARKSAWQLAYAPDRQTWHDLGDGVMIGIDRECRPDRLVLETPLDIVNPIQLGRWLWNLPCAAPDHDCCQLPKVPWRHGRQLVMRVRSDCRHVADLASYYREQIGDVIEDPSKNISVELGDVHTWIAAALALSYDICLEELYALEVLDDTSLHAAMQRLTGWEADRARMSDYLEQE